VRILLDESLPRQLARELIGHDVRTVNQQKWTGLKNGELLRRAKDNGFELFITADQKLEYQQNLARSGLGIIIIKAVRNRMDELRPLIPSLLQAISSVRQGSVVSVGA
jgi:predicted nuclease of predicted toxin-antitoxin system